MVTCSFLMKVFILLHLILKYCQLSTHLPELASLNEGRRYDNGQLGKLRGDSPKMHL